MYRVVVSESMSRLLSPLTAKKSRTAFLVLVSALVLGLAGCGPKQLTGGDPFVAVEGEGADAANRQSAVRLPDDDGRPLSPAERAALLSEGELDKGLSSEDMRDVVLHFKSLVHGGGRITVEKNIERCQFYLPYINEVLAEQKLPPELAYLAFVESGYNPLARSRTGALGMWQFIPSTGKAYGMEQNWWLDERRDPYEATRAAAAYLSKLHALFNDWHLAVTAYNAGEGKISRGLAATGAKSFFELRRRNGAIDPKDRLNDENAQYLPRFLAVCKIMRNLEALGFSSVDMSRTPRIARLTARPGTDLLALCRSSGLSWEEFSALNPAYQRYINHPGRTTTVYVPARVEADARAFLGRPQKTTAGWRQYTIARGDTMTRISRKTGVPVAELRRVNQVSEPLRAGRTLRIPGTVGGATSYAAARDDNPAPARRSAGAKAVPAAGKGSRAAGRPAPVPARAAQGTTHRVVPGDTLYSIARAYGVKVDDLVAANGLKSPAIGPGRQLRVPGVGKAPASATVAASAPGAKAPPARAKKDSEAARIVRYEVQAGDSLWAIARKFNVSPVDLLSLNNMDRDVRLRPGDTVRVAVN